MAKLSSDKKYVTVEKGDCLWNIAKKHLGSGAKYKDLATINNIKRPYTIYPGQKIYLTGSTTSSSSATASTKNKATIKQFGLAASESNDTLFAVWSFNHEHLDKFEYKWEYTIAESGDTKWLGKTGTTTDEECMYAVPDNAELVFFQVKPISKTYTVTENKQNVTKQYFEAEWTNANGDGEYAPFSTEFIPPNTPSISNLKVECNEFLSLSIRLENIDADALNATHIEFQIIAGNTRLYKQSSAFKINTDYKEVSYSVYVEPSYEYKVRCRSVKGNLVSDWSDFSSPIITPPDRPVKFRECRASSKSADGRISVYLSWDPVPGIDVNYVVEYATSRDYFDNTDQVNTLPDSDRDYCTTSALDTGQTYYFRVKAKNSAGESAWSEISDGLTLGEPPAPPTTWSSTTTATVGGPLTLYWVHNSKDGSSQTFAELWMGLSVATGIDGDGNPIYEQKWTTSTMIPNSVDPDYIDKTSAFDATAYLQGNALSYYKEGARLSWKVRTSGVTNEFASDGWSVLRVVDIYAQPSVIMTVEDATNTITTTYDTIGSFPIYISASTRPKTQAPLGFYLSITSNSVYQTVDNFGNDKLVNVGDVVYYQYFDRNTDMTGSDKVTLSAKDVDLENGAEYTLTCVASMNSGLSAEHSINFTVRWAELAYVPNASTIYDRDKVVVHIRPYCENKVITYHGVTYDSKNKTYSSTGLATEVVSPEPVRKMYMANGTEVFSEYGEDSTGTGVMKYYYLDRYGREVVIDKELVVKREYVYTTTGERVCSGYTEVTVTFNESTGKYTTVGGEEILVCEHVVANAIGDVLLSVYRREFDGSFTEIATGLSGSGHTWVTDPHPALDYARYRIVAEDQYTGAISYYDMPGVPIGETSIIIQWDDKWTHYNTADDILPAQSPWSGSMLRLPYNIDVTDSYGMDVSLVEYVGRKHPVSYYGTQLGETSTWNTTIPKSDAETLYALRRLAVWTGDCYVREPSGTGYWANVTVSFSQKHRDMTMPVTLNIKRVEGGA